MTMLNKTLRDLIALLVIVPLTRQIRGIVDVKISPDHVELQIMSNFSGVVTSDMMQVLPIKASSYHLDYTDTQK